MQMFSLYMPEDKFKLVKAFPYAPANGKDIILVLGTLSGVFDPNLESSLRTPNEFGIKAIEIYKRRIVELAQKNKFTTEDQAKIKEFIRPEDYKKYNVIMNDVHAEVAKLRAEQVQPSATSLKC